MTAQSNPDFWRCFWLLPGDVRELAKEKYRLWQVDPFHPSLHFKEIRAPIWSVRINLQYRALGLREGDNITWFWIGPHGDYDKLVS